MRGHSCPSLQAALRTDFCRERRGQTKMHLLNCNVGPACEGAALSESQGMIR